MLESKRKTKQSEKVKKASEPGLDKTEIFEIFLNYQIGDLKLLINMLRDLIKKWRTHKNTQIMQAEK